jgi:vacuole morphology and inheritance protein 14
MLLPQSSAFAALKNRLNSVSAIGYLHIANYSASNTGAPRTYVSSQISNIHSRTKSRENSSPITSLSMIPFPSSSSSQHMPLHSPSLITSSSFTSPTAVGGTTHPNQSSAHNRTGSGGGNTSTSSVVSSFEGRPNRLKAREDAQQGIRWVELLDKFRAVQERARRASRSNSIFGGAQGDFEGGYSDEPPLPTKDKGSAVGQGNDARSIARAGTPTGGRGGLVGGNVAGQGAQRPTKVGLGLGRFGGAVGGKKAKR